VKRLGCSGFTGPDKSSAILIGHRVREKKFFLERLKQIIV
jgi:hypothetical protein